MYLRSQAKWKIENLKSVKRLKKPSSKYHILPYKQTSGLVSHIENNNYICHLQGRVRFSTITVCVPNTTCVYPQQQPQKVLPYRKLQEWEPNFNRDIFAPYFEIYWRPHKCWTNIWGSILKLPDNRYIGSRTYTFGERKIDRIFKDLKNFYSCYLFDNRFFY